MNWKTTFSTPVQLNDGDRIKWKSPFTLPLDENEIIEEDVEYVIIRASGKTETGKVKAITERL